MEQTCVIREVGEPQLLYIDLHLIHEVTSPQAFEGLRLQNRKLRRPDLTFATLDHNVPTIDIFNIKDEIANKQITTLQNAIDFGVHIFDMGSDEQGIVHMVGPETGLTQPGKQSFVVTLTQQHMEHLVLLHLELEQVKLNMFRNSNAMANKTQNLKSILMVPYQQASMLRTLFCI